MQACPSKPEGWAVLANLNERHLWDSDSGGGRMAGFGRKAAAAASDFPRRLFQQILNRHLQRNRQSLQHQDRRVPYSTLDATDVGSVESVLERKLLLPEAFGLPQTAQVQG